MTEPDDGYSINVNFEGHPADEVMLKQVALGVSPALLFVVDIADEEVNFDVDLHGVPEDEMGEFLETVKEILDTIIGRLPEAGVPDAEADGSAES